MNVELKTSQINGSAPGKKLTGGQELHPATLNRRQLNKMETRKLLLEAGLELFIMNGFERTHANDITQKAGVAVGTLYLHFGNKEGLLREILLQAALELHDRVSRVYLNPPADPEELARAHIETMVKFIEENQEQARFLLGYAVQHNSVSAEVIDQMVAQIEQSLRTGAEWGVYRSDIDPALAARAEANMNLGLLAWWTEDPQRAPREKIIETLTKFRASGLHVRSKSKWGNQPHREAE